MALSNVLISEFVKVTNDDKKTHTGATVYGTAKEYGGEMYVQLDGSDLLTPIETTTNIKDGERVTVTVKNHTATVDGNLSSPAARDEEVKDVNERVDEYDVIIADKVSTDYLEANYIKAGDIEAEFVKTERLEAEYATIGKLEAEYATITELNVTNANITNLNATFGEFQVLTTDKFVALDATIKNLDTSNITTEHLQANYANIDFANIGELAVKNFMAKSGIIEDLVMSEGHVTGTLVGVTIKGDLIEGGTIVADKLVIQGDDGLYYKLNTNGETVTTQQTEYNSLSGTIITAKSITAEKVNIDDLVAFDATIGGFNISDASIYSGVKTTVDNTTRGIYMDIEGQFAFGDATNYAKYYRDVEGNYHLEISADDILFGSDKKSVEETINGIGIGGRNILLNSSFSKNLDKWTTHRSTNMAIVEDDGETCIKIDGLLTSTVAVSQDLLSKLDVDQIYTLSGWFKTTDIVKGETNYLLAFYMDGKWTNESGEANKWFSYGQKNLPTESTNEWVYFSYSFATDYKLNTAENYTFYVYARDLTGSLYVRNLKLEKGTKATDWTPAPEDVDQSIDNVSDELRTEIITQATQVSANSEEFVVKSLESYVEVGEYNDFKETVESEFSVQSEQIEMKFDSATNRVNEVETDLQETKEEWDKRFIFTEDGLTIKAGESAMQIVIDNDIIFFKKNGQSFGWWDGIDFHTGNIVVDVNERAQFGGFGFVPRSDGSLMFLKLDDSNNKYSILITSQPKACTVVNGTDAVFSIEVTGEVKKYQWQISTDGTIYTDVSESDGGTLSEITIPQVTMSDDGLYVRCILTNRLDSQTISDAVQMKVVDANTLVILTQPQDQSILLGGTAVFRVEAAGPDLHYAWRYKTGKYGVGYFINETDTWASGYDGPELKVTPTSTSMNNYTFQCMITSGTGTAAPSIESDAVTLYVTEE